MNRDLNTQADVDRRITHLQNHPGRRKFAISAANDEPWTADNDAYCVELTLLQQDLDRAPPGLGEYGRARIASADLDPA